MSAILQAENRGWVKRLMLSKAVRRAAAAVLVLALFVYFLAGRGEPPSAGTTFVARRGPLKITVVEGGEIAAIESQQIKSEVKGQTKILSIVEEGYQVTEEDVANKKVLVTLDSSELLERLTQEEIEYQSASAAYTEAKEAYEIQINQNESDVKAAELDAKFARMDLAKYLGEDLSERIVKERGLVMPPPVDLAEAMEKWEEAEANLAAEMAAAEQNGPANAPGQPKENQHPPGPDVKVSTTSSHAGADAKDSNDGKKAESKAKRPVSSKLPPVDFAKYADAALLGDGEAQQMLRKLENDRLLSEEEKSVAENLLTGTMRLAEQKFVTQTELQRDQIAAQRSNVSLESSQTQEHLFRRYEFPKQAEKLLSDYEEALRKLQRVNKQAMSKLAQSRAQLKAAEARYKLQLRQRNEIRERVDKCTIRAERPGLVVYAGSNEPWRRERIAEGATVYERQDIITIPDMTRMGVEAKIHESSIKKVAKGQKATIRIDALPDQVLSGEVFRVAVLPDSGQRWMNPDLKIYRTMVTIEGVHEGLKPGMSAEVEILVKELADVVYVPIQAVTTNKGDRVVYVVNGKGNPERRKVETGEMNEQFIEIRKGLKEGERVLLRAPQTEEPGAGTAEKSAARPNNRSGGT